MTTVAKLIGMHAGADAFVCGTGTSLADFDWTRLNGRLTVALNDAVHAPGFVPAYHLWADANLYARFCKRYVRTIAVVPARTAFLVEGDYADVVTYTHVERNERRKAATCDPRWPAPQGRLVLPSAAVGENTDELFCNHTIATAGVQLAWKLGARRIFLVGCDAYTREPAGEGNYFDGRRSCEAHHKPVDLGDGRYRTSAHIWWDMEQWRVREWFAERGHHTGPFPGEGVYNCSEASTLTAWENVPIEEAIHAEGGSQWRQHFRLSRGTRRATPSSI